MTNTAKGFCIVSEAEVDAFLEFPCFLYDPTNIGQFDISFLCSTKTSLYIWKFLVHLRLKPSLKVFEHNLTNMWHAETVQQFEHSLALPFFGVEWKLTFSSFVPTTEFFKFADVLSTAL